MKRLDAIIFLATLLLFVPTWFWLANAWLSDPYYSHGPLVLLVALYLVFVRRKVFSESAPASNHLAVCRRGNAERAFSDPMQPNSLTTCALVVFFP
jgi:Transmembrane exosortase (Exosortase_EpsH)